MSKTCNNCGKDKAPVSVPYVVHESSMARAERQAKRLIAIIILLIVLLVGSNVGWLIYESQFETIETNTEESIVVDAQENGVANYIGNDGDIYNGENYSKEKNHN
jgi:hypothetical protein